MQTAIMRRRSYSVNSCNKTSKTNRKNRIERHVQCVSYVCVCVFASERLSGVTQLKIGDVCLFICERVWEKGPYGAKIEIEI